jgi:hypothetical protein
MRIDLRTRGIRMWDRCEDGFLGSSCFRGSGEVTNVEMAAGERGVKALSPSVDLCKVGDGSTRRKRTNARGSESSNMAVHNMVDWRESRRIVE